MRRREDLGKGLVLWGARQYTCMTLAQTGRKAGGMDYTAVAMAVKRFEDRTKKRRKWRVYQRHVAEKCEGAYPLAARSVKHSCNKRVRNIEDMLEEMKNKRRIIAE